MTHTTPNKRRKRNGMAKMKGNKIRIRQKVNLGAPLQTWEQYSRVGQTWNLYIVI